MMVNDTVLIIEDERNIIELVKYNLEQEGFRVITSERGDRGLERARKEKPDFLILDLMLPGLDGLEICKILRANETTHSIPILMLTAKSEEVDKIVGLELGADDYLAKPFSPKELVARVKTILRRVKRHDNASVLKAGKLEMDLDKHIVKIKSRAIELTSKEFDLLKTLMTAKGRVLSRDQLLTKVWGYDDSINIETRTIDMHVGQLRKKIKMEANRIVTVKNVGYRFRSENEA